MHADATHVSTYDRVVTRLGWAYICLSRVVQSYDRESTLLSMVLQLNNGYVFDTPADPERRHFNKLVPCTAAVRRCYLFQMCRYLAATTQQVLGTAD